jgi:hypothetical protein
LQDLGVGFWAGTASAQKEAHRAAPLVKHLYLRLSAQSAAKNLRYSGGAILLLRSSLATTPSLIWITR